MQEVERKSIVDPTSKIPIFCLGMKFKSVHEVREAITLYTVLKGVGIKLVKNDSTRVRVESKQDYPWKMLVSIHSEDNTLLLILAKYFRQRITSLPTIKLREFKELVKIELKIHVTKHVCIHAKKKIISYMIML